MKELILQNLKKAQILFGQLSRKATLFFQSRVPGIRNLSMGRLLFLFIVMSLISRDPITTLLMIPVWDLIIEWFNLWLKSKSQR
jgi:hypothetical protein